MNVFSIRLDEAMKVKNVSQSQLSALTGIGKPSISQYLSGKNEPNNDRKKKIAEALGINEGFLMGLDVEMDGAAKMNQKITTVEAAKLMGVSKEFIRAGLQTGKLPFGTAVKMSNRWTYWINPKKFNEYLGM